MRTAFALAALSLSCAVTQAQVDLITTKSARSGLVQSSSLIQKALGYSCLGVVAISDGLACNPALNHFGHEAVLELSAQLASGYPNLNDMITLTGGKLEPDTISRLLSGDRNQLETEAQIALTFNSPGLSARYVPLSLYGVFVARNLANPEIQAKSSKAQIFEVQSSREVAPNLSAGVRLSALKIEGISYRANILDFHLPEPSQEWRFLVEPGISYAMPVRLHPRFSAVLANTGFKKGSLPWTEPKPSLDVGVSIAPEVPLGLFQVALDYRGVYEDSTPQEKLHLGAIYQLGSMSLASGVDGSGYSMGVYSTINNLGAGVLFATTNVFWRDQIAYTQTMYAQLVWSF